MESIFTKNINVFSTLKTERERKAEEDLLKLNKIISKYNDLIYKYTNKYKGCVKVPKLYALDYFVDVSEYINSENIWKEILLFVSVSGVKDIYDYMDTIIRNWNNLRNMLKIKYQSPLPRVIFSTKLVNWYHNVKYNEWLKHDMNSKIVTEENTDFTLTPTIQSDINSLIRLKMLNFDMDYNEIITVFRGEFSDEFKEITKGMDSLTIAKKFLTKGE